MDKIYVKNPDNLVNPVKDRPGKTSCRALKRAIKNLKRKAKKLGLKVAPSEA